MKTAYLVLWFIMTNGTGYREPLRIELTPGATGAWGVSAGVVACGRPGPVAPGLQFNRPVNPTIVSWPDPKVVGAHCAIDIGPHVAALPHGEFHGCTTLVGPDAPTVFGEKWNFSDWAGPDPHCSDLWLRSTTSPGLPGRPTNFGVRAQ